MSEVTHIEITIAGDWWVASIHSSTARPPIELARLQLALAQGSPEIRGAFIDMVQSCVEHIISQAGGTVVNFEPVNLDRSKLN